VVDPLQLEYINHLQVEQDQVTSILVKYYLPKHHSLVDEVFSKAASEGNNHRLDIFKEILSSTFVPIDRFHEIPGGSYVIPLLQAFQKDLPGLLREWII
jgi:hypothetical protein